MTKETYLEAILGQIPRLLGLLDRNMGSPTYGCFDRQYWHYRVVDFPCARYQEAALTLGLIYNLDYEQNIYFKNNNILEWVNASLGFWAKIQERNGSFNEWYPHENTFVATAFSIYAISETLLILGSELLNDYQLIVDHLKRGADWLTLRVEDQVVNQTSGAAIALYNIYLLTNENKYLQAAQKKLDFLEKYQNEEGWFLEYGGADIGYLSLTIDYLSKYYHKSREKKALRILNKAVSFIANFVHPDGTFGGGYGSRDTEYFIPSGFEMMSNYLEDSKIVAKLTREAIKNKSTIIPASFDDRYLAYFGYTYLQAFINAGDLSLIEERGYINSVVNYPNSGIHVIKKDNFYFVYNCKKGGVFRIVFKNHKSLDDWGILLKSAGDRFYYSGWLNTAKNCSCHAGNQFIIQTSFQEIKKLLPGPLKFIFLRIFQNVFGLNANIGMWLKRKLRKMMITRGSSKPMTIWRKFSLEKDGIIITEKIDGISNIKTVIINAKISYIYIPSSCYFQNHDLNRSAIIHERIDYKKDNMVVIRKYNNNGNLDSLAFE